MNNADTFYKAILSEIDMHMRDNLKLKIKILELKEKLLALMLENKKLKEKIEILELKEKVLALIKKSC